MNWEQDLAGENREFAETIGNFKASMDAWSDAALSRPRAVAASSLRPATRWRLAASWALGCLLATGSLAGALHVMVHRQDLAKQAAQQAEQKAAAASPQAAPATSTQESKDPSSASTPKPEAESQDAALLATVDSDVSRQVPAAMEPLAQLMDDDSTQ
jgi:hypothetical protein